MQETAARMDLPILGDEYLGYDIFLVGERYVAIPKSWSGECIEAETMPSLRKTIWRWWYQSR